MTGSRFQQAVAHWTDPDRDGTTHPAVARLRPPEVPGWTEHPPGARGGVCWWSVRSGADEDGFATNVMVQAVALTEDAPAAELSELAVAEYADVDTWSPLGPATFDDGDPAVTTFAALLGPADLRVRLLTSYLHYRTPWPVLISVTFAAPEDRFAAEAAELAYIHSRTVGAITTEQWARR